LDLPAGSVLSVQGPFGAKAPAAFVVLRFALRATRAMARETRRWRDGPRRAQDAGGGTNPEI
jgi:hypothetical protein